MEHRTAEAVLGQHTALTMLPSRCRKTRWRRRLDRFAMGKHHRRALAPDSVDVTRCIPQWLPGGPMPGANSSRGKI
eukprot:667671-Pyramimonas_sp.AAC.1